jgi:hypothetical protein
LSICLDVSEVMVSWKEYGSQIHQELGGLAYLD